jgi:hypothetical protein
MNPGDLRHDRKSQTASSRIASPCLVEAYEAFEYPSPVPFVDAAPVVINTKHHRALLLTQRHDHIGVRVPYGVVEQIADEFRQPSPVPGYAPPADA